MISFSFIIPVKHGGAVAALPHLQKLNTTSKFEIIIVEGNHPSRQRNLAAQEANGDILYFLDDDSIVSENSLTEATKQFDTADVAVVGGPSITPLSDSFLQKLFGLLLSSFFGAGAVRNRYRKVGTTRETSEKELILCNMAIRRDLFLEIGGFDERLYPNEENELLDRITAKGFKLLHAPQLAIERSQRATLHKFVRQMFSYGCGRGKQTKISKRIPLPSVIPLIFLLYLSALPLCISFSQLFIIPLYTYILLSFIFASEAAIRGGSWKYLLPAIPLFLIMHISNGCGLLVSLFRDKEKCNLSKKEEPISISVVKSFSDSVREYV